MKPGTMPKVPAAAAALSAEYNRLSVDLARHDGKLEGFERQGTIYPTKSWSDWASTTARQLAQARDGFVQLRPQHRDLATRLQDDSLFLARTSGKLGLMAQREITFGQGWGSTLDSLVANTQQAAALLAHG